MKKQVVLPGIAFTERPEPVDAGIRETGEQRSESAPPAAATGCATPRRWGRHWLPGRNRPMVRGSCAAR